MRVQAGQFIRRLHGLTVMNVVPANEADVDAEFSLCLARPDKTWSLTDFISFVVMRREGITEALTGDRHFEQAGFVALLK
jgi:hypothetical protein